MFLLGDEDLLIICGVGRKYICRWSEVTASSHDSKCWQAVFTAALVGGTVVL